ncbi:MAG: hypothetical protein OQK77_02270 [Psychromonas sp.]|nr:hypothetical protein [Psychromonas sp.]
MPKDSCESNNSRQELQHKIQETVESGQDVRETVRRITLKALTKGKLDSEEIRQVIDAVLKGAVQGAEIHAQKSKDVLLNAVSGVDDALSSAAEASKLALEETAGNLKTFTKENFQQATDNILEIEEIYLDTLMHIARGSNEFVRSTLSDLVQHARYSGTGVGRRSAELVKILHAQLGQTLSGTLTTGSQSALKVASQLSYAAAGFLDGIAQTLDSKIKNTSVKNNHNK